MRIQSANLLTLDVESWYHANYASTQKFPSPPTDPADRGVHRWIELLAEFRVESTCFVLGEFADRHPHLVRALSEAGHEIGTHMWSHDLCYEMSADQFRTSLHRSKSRLEDLTGQPVRGLRCPSWSFNPERMPWFEDIVLAEGLAYDSSVFPFQTGMYGSSSFAGFKRGLREVQPTVAKFGAWNWPITSGFFLRVLPTPVFRYVVRREWLSNRNTMIVLHPRELDPQHPRMRLRLDHSFIHYVGLRGVEAKLKWCLEQASWTSIRRHLDLKA
ncbi:MAG TPA: polysaccharide deacetylase family protein [Pseudobdellovibrionaceae bacterium]|nr:polysaccharide deacetylase family protein [Pseudobdellovibrionaceae bacterium]